MTATDIVPQEAPRGSPEIGEALVGLLSECDGLRAFGAAASPRPS